MAKDPKDDRDEEEQVEFTESEKGREALEKWAQHYDDLDGAPEDDNDR